jgi:hypothetical protein
MTMYERRQAETILALVRRRWRAAEELIRREPLDPASFAAQCKSCDIHPWMHALLTEEGRGGMVGEEAMARLSEMRTKVRLDNMALVASAEQVIDLLLGSGITPVALKGLDLLHRLYDRIDLRATDDIDLLIRAEDLDATLMILEQAGWRAPPEPARTHYIRSSHHLPLQSSGRVTVDLEIHWNLAQEERYRIDSAGLFARTVPLQVGGRTILRLEDHDLVAHLLVHHLSHYFDRRLKWMVDLQQISAQKGFDWERVASTVRSWGAVAASGISLTHMRKLMPELIPDAILEQLPVSSWRKALTWPLRSDHPLELFRNTGNRRVQLYLAAVMLEEPAKLPAWLLHRMRRDTRPSDNPLDPKETQ